MKIAIIGLGLIGGSMAIDLKKRGWANYIIGVDSDKLHAETAKNIGFVDELMSFNEAIEASELIILATPANVTLKLLPKILDAIEQQIVTDVSSTKVEISERIKFHQKRRNYVSSHPMAGTEYSGPWAAISGLFDGKAVIFTDAEDSDEKALSTIKDMYDALNMRPLYMSAYNHDTHVAYVSHISHISSFALALTVLEKEKNEKNIFNLASGGFDSTVRLAKSSAEMWTPIFMQNGDNVITVLETYINKLQEFKSAIEKNNNQEITKLILKANKIKKVLSSK
jgi:prephenate dehydrogenase